MIKPVLRRHTPKNAALLLALLTMLAMLTGAAQASPLPPPQQAVIQVAQMGRTGQAKISPELLEAMKALPPGEMLTVIVALTDQVSQAQLRATPPGANRAGRLKHVIERLQAKANASQRELKTLLARRQAEGRVGQIESLWIMNGLAVTAAPEVIMELAARPEVQSIIANATIQAPPPPEPELGLLAVPETNLQNINAPAMWAMGFTGQDIVVANLDTGVDIATHPDLAATWRGGANSWYDPYGENPTPADFNGHGTATMGIMVGSGSNGRVYGVAPGAQWIAAKIFNNSGSSSVLAIHRALQWLLDPDSDPTTPDAPHVINNSWTWTPGCGLEFQTAVQNLRAAGILPIFSAGNNPSVSYSPANYTAAFAVGAVDNSDVIDIDSSRGPSACDTTTYPEIVAPGVNIYTTDLFGMHQNYTGTSFAAPHVAAGLALLLDASPGLTVDEQETALLDGVVGLGSPIPNNTYGHGRLDLLDSLYTLGTVDLSLTQSFSPGVAIVDRPLQVTLSIVNSGPEEATEVTLTNTYSSGVTIGPISISQGSCILPGTTSVNCDVGDMPAKTSITMTMTITPTTSGITMTHTSQVSIAETDFNVRNNSLALITPVLAEAPFKVLLPLVIK